MKISELIKQLERAKELHGDQEVFIFENEEIYSNQQDINRVVKMNGKVSILPMPRKGVVGDVLHKILDLKNKYYEVKIIEFYNTEIIFQVKLRHKVYYYWMDTDGEGKLYPAYKDSTGEWHKEMDETIENARF